MSISFVSVRKNGSSYEVFCRQYDPREPESIRDFTHSIATISQGSARDHAKILASKLGLSFIPMGQSTIGCTSTNKKNAYLIVKLTPDGGIIELEVATSWKKGVARAQELAREKGLMPILPRESLIS